MTKKQDFRRWLARRIVDLEDEHAKAKKRFELNDDDKDLDQMIAFASKAHGYREVLQYVKDHGL